MVNTSTYGDANRSALHPGLLNGILRDAVPIDPPCSPFETSMLCEECHPGVQSIYDELKRHFVF